MTRILITLIFLLHFTIPGHSQQTDVLVSDPKTTTDASDTTIYTAVDLEAEFPGGLAYFRKFMLENLDGNVPVRHKAKEGTYQVVLRFVVEKTGSISNIAPETNYGYGMEKEAMRVMKKAGYYMPARAGGKNVRSYKQEKFTFVLMD
jgi:protein TonB